MDTLSMAYAAANNGWVPSYMRPAEFKTEKADPLAELEDSAFVDYKNVRFLSRFVSEGGRILPRRITGLSAKRQRKITRLIKRARAFGLMPHTARLEDYRGFLFRKPAWFEDLESKAEAQADHDASFDARNTDYATRSAATSGKGNLRDTPRRQSRRKQS